MSVSKTLLRRFHFFDLLSPPDYTRIARAANRCDLRAGTLIFQEGALGDQFYMIVSGQIEIFSTGEQGQTTLNLLEANEWFGELALLDDLPRSASARARSRVTLLTLGKSEFRWLVQTYPLVLHRLVEVSHRALRERDRAFLVEAELRAAQLAKLYSIALDITRHLDRDKALEAIRDHAIDLTNSAGGDIYLHDKSSQLLVPHASMVHTVPCRVGETRIGRAFSTRQAQPPQSVIERGCFELAAPIRIVDPKEGERMLGVLSVYRADDGTPYRALDKTMLELFASQAAIVIENADLYQSHLAKRELDAQLNAARRVQQSLIPAASPHIRGYQVAGLWHPAQQVSGDYYDFIPMADGHWGFVIADVAGKGLNAALFMANTRSILRGSAGAGGAVADIIRRANRAIEADSSGGMFVTAFFGILEPQTHRFTYVNAGHNLPLLYRSADRSVQELSGGNLALGIVPELDCDADELRFQPGDLLFMYTDGVTEATDAHESLYGEARLRDDLRAAGGETARRVIRFIDRRVREFTGAFPQSDDITVVALGRT
jgi:serine phosphatase RsbU (regulator of sigma subunit)/CRP-like cAMP-binding protein